MKITNKTKSDLTLATGEMIPAGGSISGVSKETLKANEGSAPVRHWTESGALVLSEEDVEEPVEVTPEPTPAREDVVLAAMSAVLEANVDGTITPDGRPKTEAINSVLGAGVEPTSAAERDALMDRLKKE